MNSSYYSRTIEFMETKKSCRGLCLITRFVGAALGDQKIHQALHGVELGVTDERGGFPYLRDQAHGNQRLDVMGERRRRDLQLFLQASDRHAGLAGADQRTVDFQPRRISEGFKADCCIVDLHVLDALSFRHSSQTVFLEYSKYRIHTELVRSRTESVRARW